MVRIAIAPLLMVGLLLVPSLAQPSHAEGGGNPTTGLLENRTFLSLKLRPLTQLTNPTIPPAPSQPNWFGQWLDKGAAFFWNQQSLSISQIYPSIPDRIDPNILLDPSYRLPPISQVDGVDRYGSDYRAISPATTPRDCALACLSDRGRCRAYTFVRAGYQGPQPVCYLKTPAPPETPNPCCVSGVIGSTAPLSPTQTSRGYDSIPGRFDGAADAILNNMNGDPYRYPYWPAGVPFNESGCQLACSNPARFTSSGTESRPCAAYTFQRSFGPNPAVCTTFTRVPPQVIPDSNYTSGVRRF